MEDKELAELKAYVFSLYNLQKVVLYTDYCGSELRYLYGITINEILTASALHECFERHRWDEYGERFVLQLRPLSSITDAEAIEVARIDGLRHALVSKRASNYIELTDDSYKLVIQFNGIIKLYKNDNPYHLYANLVDVLRQQSFALPVFFKGVQYSVEDLVSKGIITLLKS